MDTHVLQLLPDAARPMQLRAQLVSPNWASVPATERAMRTARAEVNFMLITIRLFRGEVVWDGWTLLVLLGFAEDGGVLLIYIAGIDSCVRKVPYREEQGR